MTGAAARAALRLGALIVVAGCGPRGPKVDAAAQRADLGALWIGEERDHEFVVANRGDAPLVLGEVRSTCGCLLAEFSRDDVAPGTERRVPVRFRADKSLGHVEKELHLGTNDPAAPWLVFTLAADVAALYTFDPPAVVWRELVVGEPATQRVTIAVADGSAPHFRAPQSPQTGFTATLVAPEATTTNGGAAAIVELAFDGHAQVGSYLFHVVVPGDHPRVAEARVPVEAVVHGRLDLPDGELVDFGTVAAAAGSRVTKRVRLRGRAPLAAATPTATVHLGPSAAAAIAATWSIDEPGRAWTLALSVAPGSSAGSLVGRVDLSLPGSDEPPRALTLAGRVVDR